MPIEAGGPPVLNLVAFLGLLCLSATLLVLAILGLFAGNVDVVEQQLSIYGRRAAAESGKAKQKPKTRFLPRSLKVPGALLLRRPGSAEDLQTRIDQANLPIRASEFAMGHLVTVVMAATIILLLTKSWWLLAGAVGAGAAIPLLLLNFFKRRRLGRFHDQLPETLSLLSGALKAGYSFMQALDMAAEETRPPISVELGKVITETQLGQPLEDSLDSLASRIQSPDLDWTVMAVKIQKEVGGNLAEVLEILAETLRERGRISRQISALTAEGRLSAIILFLLPFVIGGIIFFLNPAYLSTLTDTLAGRIMIGIAVLSMGLGGLWLKKVTTIRV